MIAPLPTSAIEFMDWDWPQIEPYYQELENRRLDADHVDAWLADWSRIAELIYETYQRHYVAITVDTTNEATKKRYDHFVDEIQPQAQAAEQKLKEKLIASGLEPAGFAIPLRNLRAQTEIYRSDNLPLIARELKLSAEYDRIIGAQTIPWNGKEITILQARPLFQETERAVRERAWRMTIGRQLADRQAINELWRQLLEVRMQLAQNAGFSNYRDYRWKQMLRFDYTPQDCVRFHQAIEKVVVPAVQHLYEKRRRRLGVKTLRLWDLEVDPQSRPPLRPFQDVSQLEQGVAAIIQAIDPQLGAYFDIMRREGLLDLENRKGKAPGGYCTDFPASRRPFIFMNAVGIHDDVQTLLHEGGHSFHVFESAHLPYAQQKEVGLEFAEVASTSMEYLGAQFLTNPGGFYSPAEAARARIAHLEETLAFWPYMAVVDAFQHWVYENASEALDPSNCDQKWSELWRRFMIGVDWSDMEEEMATGWQRKLHILQSPFYYIEYGLAQLGAFQVWRNSLKDAPGAVAAYRRALSLGGSVALPDLYRAAGARLAFDELALKEAVDLALQTIHELEQIHA
ncbi:MAG: M3 family oligoendopeptidase [Anaerolineales bacterium]|nr:M3 family oligoendopeptidase [Anaerolineales bacterium]